MSPLRFAITVVLITLVAACDDEAASGPSEPEETSSAVRSYLSVDDLTGRTPAVLKLMPYASFAPVGDPLPAKHVFSGRIAAPAFDITFSEEARAPYRGSQFPPISFEFFSRDGVLVPTQQGVINPGPAGPWDIIVGPG